MSALPPLPKVRNPRTQAVIRRETLWQITVPLAVAGLITLALIVLIGLGTAVPAQTGALADFSLIFLIVIAFGAGLVALIIVAGLVFAAGYLLRETPFWLKRAQDFVWGVSLQVKGMTRQVDNRIVGVHISLAALIRIWEQVRALFAPWRTP
ncbi:MAG: hypothetical protein KA764_02650 [Anaerolineales bacterium]|nr:hypothetical protein [Anaerolineales bacterium]